LYHRIALKLIERLSAKESGAEPKVKLNRNAGSAVAAGTGV